LHNFVPPDNPEVLRIIPFGGCGEFGMNLTNYLYQGKLFVVDAGVLFPDPSKLGIGSIVPDVSKFFAKSGGVFAYVITHGHEDHIGALPFLYEQYPAPIYATPWTAALIRRKFEKTFSTLDSKHLKIVVAGDKAMIEGIEFRYVHANHSIPQACSLHIKTSNHSIFHTGDFKCDNTPPPMDPKFSLQELEEIGKSGVDLLLSDSTNAIKTGWCPSEDVVKPALVKVLKEAKGAVIGTTFSSNLWRLRSFIEAAQEAGRKVLICGRGLNTTLEIANETNVYTPPSNILVEEQNSDNIPKKDLLVLATGCQGEWRAALTRMSKGEGRAYKIGAGDTVVFSSRMIPGNEKPIINLTNQLLKIGAKIITTREVADIHVSGHAYSKDLDTYINALKPKNHVPVHGSVAHQHANIGLGVNRKFPVETHHISNGDVWELENGKIRTLDNIEVDLKFVDNDSQVSLSRSVMRERLRIGESGAAVLSGVFSRTKKNFLCPVNLELFGVGFSIDVDESEWCEDACRRVESALILLFKQGTNDSDVLIEQTRINMRRQLSKSIGKKPIVINKIQII
jgi:ribonuclease J